MESVVSQLSTVSSCAPHNSAVFSVGNTGRVHTQWCNTAARHLMERSISQAEVSQRIPAHRAQRRPVLWTWRVSSLSTILHSTQTNPSGDGLSEATRKPLCPATIPICLCTFCCCPQPCFSSQRHFAEHHNTSLLNSSNFSRSHRTF